MKTLIVDDDFTNRLLLQEILSEYGKAHAAMNGKEAVEAFNTAMESGEPYDLVCMDILMPEMKGEEALHLIREAETATGIDPGDGAKVFMITAVNEMKHVMKSYRELCNDYLVKPIDKEDLVSKIVKLGLISA